MVLRSTDRSMKPNLDAILSKQGWRNQATGEATGPRRREPVQFHKYFV